MPTGYLWKINSSILLGCQTKFEQQQQRGEILKGTLYHCTAVTLSQFTRKCVCLVFEERVKLCPLEGQGSIIQARGEFSLPGSTSQAQTAMAVERRGNGEHWEALLRAVAEGWQSTQSSSVCRSHRAEALPLPLTSLSPGPCAAAASCSGAGPDTAEMQPHKRNCGTACFCPPFRALQQQGSPWWLSWPRMAGGLEIPGCQKPQPLPPPAQPWAWNRGAASCPCLL